MNNISYTLRTWMELMDSFDIHTMMVDSISNLIYFMGKRVLFDGDNVTLYDGCDYCKTKNGRVKEGIYGGYYCGHCGAPITAKLRGKR